MKIKKITESSKFYTDGVKTIKVKDGEVPPEGFHLGRTFKSNPWNKGLTKDTSDKVKSNVESSVNTRKNNGSYENPWNKGLTKDTDDRLKDISKKVSDSKKGKPSWNKGIPQSEESKLKQSQKMKGHTPWNKGLTKETSDSIQSTSNKLKGHKCFVTDWDVAKTKEYETRKTNNTFNSSKPEEDFINNLKSQYGDDDVISQYRDKRYPFNCDAYIKSKDLFIEYNGTWVHGGHPFDETNLDDISKLEFWEEKSQTSVYYKSAIYTWTNLDVRKLDTARKNNLNFQFIYPNGLIIDK